MSAPPPDNLQLLRHLQLRVAQGFFLPDTNRITIYEADVYSAAPPFLVGAFYDDGGTGDDSTCYYFFSPANFISSGKRKRKVDGGGADNCCWHPEGGKSIIVGEDGESAGGYARQLSFVMINTPGPGGVISRKSSGWCMTEIELQQQGDGVGEIVLCKVYKSNRTRTGAFISAAAAADHRAVPPVVEQRPAGRGISENAPAAAVDLPDGDISSPCVLACEAAPPDGGKGAAAMVHTIVMKFCGSSIASPEKMKGVAQLLLSLAAAGERPVVVLSAMGETTNNLILASEAAISCDIQQARLIYERSVVMELHLRTIKELGLDKSVVSGSLDELTKLLDSVAMTSELTPTTRHHLASLGERMPTEIFSAYLNKVERKARPIQFDAFDVDSEDFTDADILEATYPALSKKLQGDWIGDPAIPIVTSFVAKVSKSGAITTLGSDLTAMIIGKALGSREIQIWKDEDGVLTDFPKAILAPCLTFDEATELAYAGAQVLHPQSMRLAMEGGITIIIKNSCNPKAPGTIITQPRDMNKSTLSSIVLKSNVLVLDITSKRIPARTDFQAQVLSIFKDSSVSADCEANWEGKILLTLYPSKLHSPKWMRKELDNVVKELEKIAHVYRPEPKSIVSLIGNVQKSSFILGKVSKVLEGIGVNVQFARRVPKNQVLSVALEFSDDCEARRCVQVLHSEFLEDGFLPKADGAENEWPPPVNNSSARRGRSQSDDGFPESAPGVRQARTDAVPIAPELEEIERSNLMSIDAWEWDPTGFFAHILGAYNNDPIHVDFGGGLAAGVYQLGDHPLPVDGVKNARDPTEFYAAAIDDGNVRARMITPIIGGDNLMPIGADDEGGSFSAVVLPDADKELTPVDGGFIPARASWLVDGGEAQQQELAETTEETGSGLLDAVLQLEGEDIDEFLGTSSGSHAMSAPPPAS